MPNAPLHYRPRTGSGKAFTPREARGTAHQRGYGWDWSKVRVIAWHDPDKVLCDHCRLEGRAVPRDVLDHVIPITGRSDPLRLDLADIRGLCTPHHQAKTARQDRLIRAEFDRLITQGTAYEAARDAVVERWRRKAA